MSQLVVPLTGGRRALVSDDMDDAGVWEVAKAYDCTHVLMVPDSVKWLAENIDHLEVRRIGFENLPRPLGRTP